MKINMALERHKPINLSEANDPVLGNLLVAQSLADVAKYAQKIKISGWRARILPFEEWLKGPLRVDYFVLVSGISHDPGKDPEEKGDIVISDGNDTLLVDSNWNPWTDKFKFMEAHLPRAVEKQFWERRDGLLYVTYSKNPAIKDIFRLVRVSEYPSEGTLEERIVRLKESLENKPLLAP